MDKANAFIAGPSALGGALNQRARHVFTPAF
jgi:hypothetical protein